MSSFFIPSIACMTRRARSRSAVLVSTRSALADRWGRGGPRHRACSTNESTPGTRDVPWLSKQEGCPSDSGWPTKRLHDVVKRGDMRSPVCPVRVSTERLNTIVKGGHAQRLRPAAEPSPDGHGLCARARRELGRSPVCLGSTPGKRPYEIVKGGRMGTPLCPTSISAERLDELKKGSHVRSWSNRIAFHWLLLPARQRPRGSAWRRSPPGRSVVAPEEDASDQFHR
jgi:hypothetical protein